MTPREQLRKMTALGEQGALEEKHWYRLVNGMSAGGRSIPLKKKNEEEALNKTAAEREAILFRLRIIL